MQHEALPSCPIWQGTGSKTVTVLQKRYLWDVTKATVFTYFNIRFLILLYQTHGPVCLETSRMDPYVSGRRLCRSPHDRAGTSTGGWWATKGTFSCAEETPKIAHSQLSQLLFSSARSQFHSEQLLKKTKVLWIVVTGFILTSEYLRYIVLA